MLFLSKVINRYILTKQRTYEYLRLTSAIQMTMTAAVLIGAAALTGAAVPIGVTVLIGTVQTTAVPKAAEKVLDLAER